MAASLLVRTLRRDGFSLPAKHPDRAYRLPLPKLQRLRLLLACRFTRGHGEWIQLRRGVDSFSSIKQTFDRENLDARIIFVVPELGCVASSIGGFGAHLFTRFF